MAMTGQEYVERLVDRDSLADYLVRTIGDAESLTLEYHQAGHSNETFFLEWGDRELVLRRPPAGETGDAAHDVLREYRVMDALQETPIPVPTTVAGCTDHDVIGADFYLMERLHGDVIRDEEPDRFATPDQRGELSERFVDTLAEIHTLDPASVGLDELGHPDGYTERQVERWTQQLQWAFEVTAEDRTVPKLGEAAKWLESNVPDDYDHTLVHGDYKLDNVMFGPGTPPEIVGVFDWEMCTRGDPSMDLGWLLVYWPEASDPEPTDSMTTQIPRLDGYPTRRELLDRYEARTGVSFDHDRFYRAFGTFKMASACEMMYRRYLEGNSDNPSYPKMETRVPGIAERTMRIIDGEEPL
ncbi:MAG: phosphotransferase family protein [Natronomonas sp.]